MDAKWDSYTHFPASGEEFERYVGTVFDDLGYRDIGTKVCKEP